MAIEQGTPAPAELQATDPRRYLQEIPQSQVVARCVHHGEPVAKVAATRPRIASRSGRAYRPGSVKDHKRTLAAIIRPQLAAGEPDCDWAYGIRAIFYVQTHQRKDVDNMLCVVQNALNRLAFNDDSQVKELMGWSVLDCQNPRTEFVVYRIQKIARETGSCIQCGATFRRYRSWKARLYCSRKCNAKAVSSAVEVPCAHCGKQLLRVPAEIEKNKGGEFFCSGACIGKHKRRETNCAHCGAAISRPNSWTKKAQTLFYCNRSCQAAAQVGRKLNVSPERLSDRSRRAWITRRANHTS